MKGRGIRSERETVVRWDEEGDTANIWTTSEITYRHLKKRGYSPVEDAGRSASFVIPKRDIKLPRPKSEKRSQLARRRSEASQASSFSPGTPNRAMVRQPNGSQTYARVKKAHNSSFESN